MKRFAVTFILASLLLAGCDDAKPNTTPVTPVVAPKGGAPERTPAEAGGRGKTGAKAAAPSKSPSTKPVD
jgi:hypothetical protein